MNLVTYSRKAKVPCHSLQHVLWIDPTVLVTRFALKGEQAEVLRRFQLHAGVRSFDGTTHEGFELKVLRPCSLARQRERERVCFRKLCFRAFCAVIPWIWACLRCRVGISGLAKQKHYSIRESHHHSSCSPFRRAPPMKLCSSSCPVACFQIPPF